MSLRHRFGAAFSELETNTHDQAHEGHEGESNAWGKIPRIRWTMRMSVILKHSGILGVTSVRDPSSVGFQSRAEAHVEDLESEDHRKEHIRRNSTPRGRFEPAPTAFDGC